MMARRGQVNPWVLGIGLALIVPVLVLFAVSFGNNPREVPSVLETKPAPGFTLVDLDGRTWSLEALRGKPVVLNFWSTWCLPCRQEHPLLQQAAALHTDVQFLGVIYADEPDKCRRYLREHGTSYHHLVDAPGAASIDYGVAGVPETFFINGEGIITYKHAGPLDARTLAAALRDIRGPQ